MVQLQLTPPLGKALYRALLELCPRVPLPADLPSQGAVNPIEHLIRKGFRRRQYNASPRLAVKALTVGYNVSFHHPRFLD
jgi:hypothetical protein